MEANTTGAYPRGRGRNASRSPGGRGSRPGSPTNARHHPMDIADEVGEPILRRVPGDRLQLRRENNRENGWRFLPRQIRYVPIYIRPDVQSVNTTVPY